jgi:hypothetical protein
MAMVEITAYSVYWHQDTKAGDVRVNLVDDTSHTLTGLSADEVHMLVDLLRNEKPVYYSVERQVVFVAWEPVGEGEDALNALRPPPETRKRERPSE